MNAWGGRRHSVSCILKLSWMITETRVDSEMQTPSTGTSVAAAVAATPHEIKRRRRPIQKSEYLAERAYRDLRQRIIAGEFAPGDHLKENTLVPLLRVSRSVVRQALIRLTAEGLLLDSPKRGKTLAVFTEEQIAKLVPIRVCLEQLALREAIPRLTDSDCEELKSIAAKLTNPELDPAGHDALEVSFHRKIWQAADNDELVSLLTQVVGPFHMLGNAVLMSPFYRRSAPVISLQHALLERERDAGGHQLLAEAICRREVEGSCRLMAEHLTVNYAINPDEFGQRVGKLVSRYWHPETP